MKRNSYENFFTNLDLSKVDSHIDQLNKEICGDSLFEYAKYIWPVLEPARRFSENWSIHAICEHLQAVTDGQITRLLINVPPGTMKSLTTEVIWPTWEWGPRNRPDLRYVSFSYSIDLTIRDNRKSRQVIASSLYQRLWGDRFTIADDQDTKTKFENDHKGFKLATSVGGVGTGERGDRGIVDDPHNVIDGESEKKRKRAITWFGETLPTRVNDPDTSPLVVIMQRVHNEDVSGHILAQELGYEHLMLPMEYEPDRACYTVVRPTYMDSLPEKVSYDRDKKLWVPDPEGSIIKYKVDPREVENELIWPNRMSRQTIERDKKAMGSYAVAGQYQQRPVPRGGGMFTRGWFEIIDSIPEPVVRRSRGWDLAATKTATSPYTSGVRMAKGKSGAIYIEDVQRTREGPLAVELLIGTILKEDPLNTITSIPQDPGQAGKAQKSYLGRRYLGHNVRFSIESGSKEMRANALSAQAEAGNVYLIRGDWNTEYLNEMTLFPNSQYKDQVDASSRAFHELVKETSVGLVGPETVGEDV